MTYPIDLIKDYKQGAISRCQFIKQFSELQKSHGINYDCKVKADFSGIHVNYRGTEATFSNGRFCSKKIKETATTIFEFCRKVDFALNKDTI